MVGNTQRMTSYGWEHAKDDKLWLGTRQGRQVMVGNCQGRQVMVGNTQRMTSYGWGTTSYGWELATTSYG